MPFDEIKVGYFYQTKDFDREPARNRVQFERDSYMPHSSKSAVTLHPVLVIAKNPDFRIVRYMVW